MRGQTASTFLALAVSTYSEVTSPFKIKVSEYRNIKDAYAVSIPRFLTGLY